jgi:hypothetical protein
MCADHGARKAEESGPFGKKLNATPLEGAEILSIVAERRQIVAASGASREAARSGARKARWQVLVA